MFALNFVLGQFGHKIFGVQSGAIRAVFFFFQSCDVGEVIGSNRALDELAKSGYKQTMKVKFKRIRFVFLATYLELRK
jgi:hypothetical protein